MEAHTNYIEYFSTKIYNEFESLSLNIKTTVSLSSTFKSGLNITKASEQVNTLLLSKALALYDISIPDDLNDYSTLPSPHSKECPSSPLIKYKDHNFEGSSFTLN